MLVFSTDQNPNFCITGFHFRYFYKKLVTGLESAFYILATQSKFDSNEYIISKRNWVGMMRAYNQDLNEEISSLCFDIFDTEKKEEIGDIQFYSLVYVYSKVRYSLN